MISPLRLLTVLVSISLGASAVALVGEGVGNRSVAANGGHIRSYYIAADEVEWDYAPSGRNQITGHAFDQDANVFVQRGPARIGRVYRKAHYRAYTDATFTRRKAIPAPWQHLGILGPVIRAEVGDTIKVVFKNNLTMPASMHPHGVRYAKASEGAPYADGTTAGAKQDDAVPPGAVHHYTWEVPQRAGPGPMDPSSVLWMYHSHTDEVQDGYAGLIGPIIVSARGTTKADGTPRGVDREFVTLFMIFNENQSPYLAHNIQTYAERPVTVKPDDEAFRESNLKHSINGYVYGNLPLLTMHQGERVRWYVLDLGTEVDLHTPHWHGQTLLINGMRTDVAELLPGSMKVGDMRPDAAGIRLYHCHVNDNITAGMQARFQVVP
jgi:manganese oxidase